MRAHRRESTTEKEMTDRRESITESILLRQRAHQKKNQRQEKGHHCESTAAKDRCRESTERASPRGGAAERDYRSERARSPTGEHQENIAGRRGPPRAPHRVHLLRIHCWGKDCRQRSKHRREKLPTSERSLSSKRLPLEMQSPPRAPSIQHRQTAESGHH